MAQPEARYKGNQITCYPGSNQKDDGKLNLEANMARIVTRVTSKNFCIIEPSFKLTAISDASTATPKIQVDVGQACINGMDFIMTGVLTIDPPETEGDFYLAFHIARDGSVSLFNGNVLGDTVIGVDSTFEGLYLSYYNDKPDPMDPDMLYLGKLTWDGNEFSNIEEDEDKYGRLWADDILCKLEDPKHPDDRRLTLQEWLEKVPDWYFSKEGDTLYGPFIIVESRENPNPGILQNVDENGSHITVKDPDSDNDKLQFYGDLNRDGVIDEKDLEIAKQIVSGQVEPNELQKHLGDVNHDGVIDEKDVKYLENFINKEGNGGDTGNVYYTDSTDNDLNVDVNDERVLVEMGKADIYSDKSDGTLHVHNEGDICVDAEGELRLEADSDILISTEDPNSPKLKVTDDKVSITDPTAPNLEFNVSFPSQTTIQQTLGKAIWQYDELTKYVSLLENNVEMLEVVPDGLFRQNLRVQDVLYLGTANSNDDTSLSRTDWYLRENAGSNVDYIHFTPTMINIVNPELSDIDNSSILLQNTSNTIHTRIYDKGEIELLNNTNTTPKISFKDGNATYDVTLEKIKGEKRLNIVGNLSVSENVTVGGALAAKGLTTTNGVLTFQNGTNNATITKDSNSTNLRTSGPLYVGATGNQALFAGNTTVTGTFGAGSTQQFKIDANGNASTSGTITGTKVFGAVYQDFAEVYEKDEQEKIEPGDIVYIREDGKVSKVTSKADTNKVIGIVSENPGICLGTNLFTDTTRCEVAIIGKVYVKTNDKNLNVGDIVVASESGATKLTSFTEQYDIILGKVIEKTKDNKVKIRLNMTA